MKFGEMLVQEKIITQQQLDEALVVQSRNPDKKLGEILLELEYINIDEFAGILDRQLKEGGLGR